MSPSKQPDGSIKVTAVWTNTQAAFGTDADVTLGVVTVSGTAPDLIPQPLTDLAINSNIASVVFHLSPTDVGGVAAASSSTTTAPKTSTTVRATTTTARGATTTTLVRSSTTSTTRLSTTTTVRPTTTTTKLLGIF
ncbi:MAG: hypothetical protein M3066_05160 [Actinomycetota bacterium]|nr:hypothetical protein [Actinomycetota bacterium]